jgi:ribosomal protein L17
MDDEWIKKPTFDPPSVDPADVDKKYEGIASDINKFEEKLVKQNTTPSNAKELYEKAGKLKEKIMKMRKEGLQKEGEFSVGNLAFKKLRNEGYIEKLIDTISQAYDKIYSE